MLNRVPWRIQTGILLVLVSPAVAHGGITVGAWQRIYDGVYHATGVGWLAAIACGVRALGIALGASPRAATAGARPSSRPRAASCR